MDKSRKTFLNITVLRCHLSHPFMYKVYEEPRASIMVTLMIMLILVRYRVCSETVNLTVFKELVLGFILLC